MVFFIFNQVLIENYASKQWRVSGDPDQTPHSVASDLGLHICLCPKKRTLGIYGLKCNYFAYLIRVAEILEVYC